MVIPAYCAAGTIAACLIALKAQATERTFEIIVVDDASTDRTAELAQEHGATVLQQPKRLGAAAARNKGLQVARAEIICFTDADCQPRDDWLEQMLVPFAQQSVSGAKGIYATRQPQLTARFVQVEYEDKYDLLRKQEHINFIDTYSAAYRRSTLVANDGFDEDMTYLEDQELSFRLAARGYKMVFAPGAVVIHQHSATLRAYARKKLTIGYWKAQIVRRFPGRAIQDSHTPQVMKLQMIFVAAILCGLAGMLITPYLGILTLAAATLFGISVVPFLFKAWGKDRPVAFAAPFFLLVRALALGFGYGWGMIQPQRDLSKEYTIDGLNYFVKRLIDVIGSILGLLLTGVLAPFIASAIKVDSEGPVLFKQERIGEEGQPFTLLKFRSMCAGAETELAELVDLNSLPEPAYKLHNDPRLTRTGRFLRRWSLDELPQFWNVLRGEMSLVGPRPEESQIVALYDDWQRRRLSVRPGMTGPMQVSGRGDLPMDQRLDLELSYIENYSLWRDAAILARTIPAIIRGEGAR